MSLQATADMAKGRGRPKGDRDDITIKFDRKLKMKADLIAADKGVSTVEYISELARPAIDKAYATLVKKVDEDKKPKEKP